MSKKEKGNGRNDKNGIRGKTTPSSPGLPVNREEGRASSGAAMKVFPAWMYHDPADVAEHVEIAVLRAEERRRRRELERRENQNVGPRWDTSARSELDSTLDGERPRPTDSPFRGPAPKRIALRLVDLRLTKRARIQSLVRVAMKERK